MWVTIAVFEIYTLSIADSKHTITIYYNMWYTTLIINFTCNTSFKLHQNSTETFSSKILLSTQNRQGNFVSCRVPREVFMLLHKLPPHTHPKQGILTTAYVHPLIKSTYTLKLRVKIIYEYLVHTLLLPLVLRSFDLIYSYELTRPGWWRNDAKFRANGPGFGFLVG